ncbi:MAG: translational GTPase TypA, partial [Clostridiaceae bacterium]|nr:translational GTPase TypA [Clostridiaceae bacterium]
LDATEEQIDSPVVYASGREGFATLSPDEKGRDLKVLFDLILSHIPAPEGDEKGPFQMLVSNIDYDEYTGRIAVGRINRGFVKVGDRLSICQKDGSVFEGKVSKLYVFDGLSRRAVNEAECGDIVAISGISEINIGDTICAFDNPDPLPYISVDEPVLSMTFSVNDSPFAGREGKFVTSRHLRDRLLRELESNIALKVEETGSPDSFIVSGRGELHLSVLIENMRRQGYEFQVSKPKVITKIIDGNIHEPIEHLTVDVPEEYTGVVMEGIGSRKGELLNMAPSAQGYVKMEFYIPARGLIGLRSELLTATKGMGVINHVFSHYDEYKGEILSRNRGALISFEQGEAITYGLYNAQARGTLFIGPGEEVYEGMVVGESSRLEDITVNVCKRKHATNMRAAGSDDALKLTPPKIMSLEQCLEFIADDELLEVTPTKLRIRKKILDTALRAKAQSKNKS